MLKIQIAQDNINLINKLRSEGKSMTYISNRLNISKSHLRKSLKKLNIKLEPIGYCIEKKKEIIKLYTQGFGYEYIEANVKVHDATIKKTLLDANIPVRHKTVDLLPKLSNENLIIILNSNKDIEVEMFNPFSRLSQDKVQYWLGYLAADGCITNNYISLSSIDLIVLEEFRTFLRSKNKINENLSSGYGSLNSCYSLSKGSITWCRFLHNLGLIPRKTKTLELKMNLTFSFLRGLLDGDGTILLPPLHKYSGSVRWFTASEPFANQILNFLKKYVDANLYKREKGYEIVVGNKESIKRLYNYLYSIDTISLKRKKEKYNKLREALFGNK